MVPFTVAGEKRRKKKRDREDGAGLNWWKFFAR
jgi:hypothetical protein